MSENGSQTTPEGELIDGIRAALEGWSFRKQAATAAVGVMKSQGWSKPYMVTSAELDETLPIGSVVRHVISGWVLDRQDDGNWYQAGICNEIETRYLNAKDQWIVLFTPEVSL